jgi:putative transposase
LSHDSKKELITSDNVLSISRQCDLIGMARSTYYYEPRPESADNLRLMKMIDQLYLKAPFYGHRSITNELRKMGEEVNKKRVHRLMKNMGLVTMYPKPRFNLASKEDYKYPYLLNKLMISRPNQVWGTDITYIPIETGYLYLIAILDLFSRYVISWILSNNMGVDFCIKALEKALKNGFKPEIMNSDQGVQFTSKAWTNVLKQQGITISMSGKGRCWDNIFVERLWRSVKYEEVYLKDYSTSLEAEQGLNWYFNFYNAERIHTSLGQKVPKEVYYSH